MISRRSFIARAVGLVGATVVAQKWPLALAAERLARDDRSADALMRADRAALRLVTDRSLVIRGCRFEPGDPAANDPDWIEEQPDGLLVRDRVFRLAGPLTLPGDVRIFIDDCDFDEVPLVLRKTNNFVVHRSRFAVRHEPGLTIDGRSTNGSITHNLFRSLGLGPGANLVLYGRDGSGFKSFAVT